MKVGRLCLNSSYIEKTRNSLIVLNTSDVNRIQIIIAELALICSSATLRLTCILSPESGFQKWDLKLNLL